MEIHSRFRRLARRLPLRLALFAIRPVGAFSSRWHMALQIPILARAGVTFLGTPRYISPTVHMDDYDKITIGERVVISSHVSLLTHDYSVTTAMIAAGEFDSSGDIAAVRAIQIGRNVFIGRGSIVMPGTTIEDHVVVGAGSVVRGRVGTGTVIVGNPAEPTGSIADLYTKHRGHERGMYRQDAG